LNNSTNLDNQTEVPRLIPLTFPVSENALRVYYIVICVICFVIIFIILFLVIRYLQIKNEGNNVLSQ